MILQKISRIWLKFESCMGNSSGHRKRQEAKPQISRGKKIIVLPPANRTAIELQLVISDLDSFKCLG